MLILRSIGAPVIGVLDLVAASGAATGGGGTSTASSPPSGTLVFDSNFVSGNTNAYPTAQNRNRCTIVDDPESVIDPDTDEIRRVARWDVYESDNQLTGNPRSQLEGPYFWDDGEDYYIGVSFYLPSARFPAVPYAGWVNLVEVYGPPWNGAAPCEFFVSNEGTERLQQIIQGGYNPRTIPWNMAATRDKWHDFVWHVKLSSITSPSNQGYTETWYNGGSGWVRLQSNGQDRYYYHTFNPNNDDSPNNPLILHYRAANMSGWTSGAHGHFTTDQRVGTTFQIVAPQTYGPPPATEP